MGKIHIATVKGDIDTVRNLLKDGTDPNVRAEVSSFTPLMLAAGYNQLDIVKLLLDYGADPKLKNKFGSTAYDMAFKMKFQDVLDILEPYYKK